jgi:signal peptidase II
VAELFMNRWSPNQLIFAVTGAVYLFDQITKFAVQRLLDFREEHFVLDGFFRFVHWGNTGAAWSMFRDSNLILAVVSVAALIALFVFRNHFEVHRRLGQLSLGLIFGGILGNLTDRLIHKHVVDFLYFYLNRRDGTELGFPAFNVADSAICTGVGLILLMSFQHEEKKAKS